MKMGIVISTAIVVALYAIAMALGFITPRINRGQDSQSAWRLRLGQAVLDLSPWTLDVPLLYRPRKVSEVLDGWGRAGRRLALVLHLTVDVAFPLAYAVALTMAIGSAARFDGISAVALRSLPIAAAIADWTENAAIARLALRYPNQASALDAALWVISCTKWVLLIASGAALIALLVADGRRS